MAPLDSDLDLWLAPRTRREAETGCLAWRGALFDGYAYGRLLGGAARKIPRAVYVRMHGPLPSGMAVRQTCGNRACCEPSHLVAMTRGQAVLAGKGACAENARKTACKRGHPFDAANTYLDPAGRRRCRACKPTMERAWHRTVGRKARGEPRHCQVLDHA